MAQPGARRPDGPQVRTAGHRLRPHTADRIVEAWAPDLPSCLEEALTGLVRSFAYVADPPVTEVVPVTPTGPDPADALVSLTDDLLCALDVLGVVPVRFHLRRTETGEIAGDMDVVPVSAVTVTGAPPKGVSYHGLAVECRDGSWHCRMLVDV